MLLTNLAVPTPGATQGMALRTAFEICVSRNVPGIPYLDENGAIVGRISLRHSLKAAVIPEYLVKAAHMLGDEIHEVNIPHMHARDLLDQPVEGHLLERFTLVSSESPVIKALAIMEQHNTGYLFVEDRGVYQGVVTRMSIVQRILEAVPGNEEI